MSSRAAQFNAELIASLVARLKSNDLRGYTREQVEAAIAFYGRGGR